MSRGLLRVSEQRAQSTDALDELGPLLDRLEELLDEAQTYEQAARDGVFEILDSVDALHRLALSRLVEVIGPDVVESANHDPAVKWLFEAYGIGVDDIEAAERALEPMKPYLTEHGGAVEVLAVDNGVVRLRMAGACSGCSGAAVTLQEGVAEAFRNGLPGFVAIDVEPDHGSSHAPPGPTLLQIQPRPA